MMTINDMRACRTFVSEKAITGALESMGYQQQPELPHMWTKVIGGRFMCLDITLEEEESEIIAGQSYFPPEYVHRLGDRLTRHERISQKSSGVGFAK